MPYYNYYIYLIVNLSKIYYYIYYFTKNISIKISKNVKIQRFKKKKLEKSF